MDTKPTALTKWRTHTFALRLRFGDKCLEHGAEPLLVFVCIPPVPGPVPSAHRNAEESTSSFQLNAENEKRKKNGNAIFGSLVTTTDPLISALCIRATRTTTTTTTTTTAPM